MQQPAPHKTAGIATLGPARMEQLFQAMAVHERKAIAEWSVA